MTAVQPPPVVSKPSWKQRAEEAEGYVDELQEALDIARDAERASAAHLSRAGQALAEWHDEQHGGTFRFCSVQPCHALHDVTDGCLL